MDEKKEITRTDWGKKPEHNAEDIFLEGPQSRTFDFLMAFRVMAEMIRGFRALHFVGPCITVFGSARFTEDHRYYKLAEEVGAKVALLGFTVMTGGGPGIMEAANRGAKSVKGRSIGCNIVLPHEQHHNPWVDQWIEFNYFFVRKLMLIKYSYAFIALPGGFGTLDEFFEVATLVQTKKVSDFPLIFVGKEYWGPLMGFIEETFVKNKTIHASDLKKIVLVDTAEEAVAHLRSHAITPFGLKLVQRKPRKILMEHETLPTPPTSDQPTPGA